MFGRQINHQTYQAEKELLLQTTTISITSLMLCPATVANLEAHKSASHL
jgi:hypothetical protein